MLGLRKMRLIPQPFANRRFKAGRAVAEEQRVFARRLHAVEEQRQLFHRVFRQALAALCAVMPEAESIFSARMP